MDLGEEPTTVSLLNQHNPKTYSKYSSLYPQVCIIFIPHHISFFFYQKEETITKAKNHNQSKRRVVPPNRYIWKNSSCIVDSRNIVEMGVKSDRSQRIRICCEIVSLEILEPTSTKSHQDDGPNMSCIKKTTIYVLNWMVKDEAYTLYEELQVKKE